MPQEPERHFVESMTWDAVAARIGEGALAVLPIGAGAKEHGLHLPMNTDRIQADYFAGVLASQFDALIWPVVSYGHYPAFAAYPGSVSLNASLFEETVRELVVNLSGAGCRRVVVLDTGISTIAPAARALNGIANSFHAKLHDGPQLRLAVSELSAQPYGSHADEIETSLMLAIAPELVRMARAQASPGHAAASGPLTPFDKTSPNFSPSGSYGDPTLATREKGQRVREAMTRDLIEGVSGFLRASDTAQAASRKVSS